MVLHQLPITRSIGDAAAVSNGSNVSRWSGWDISSIQPARFCQHLRPLEVIIRSSALTAKNQRCYLALRERAFGWAFAKDGMSGRKRKHGGSGRGVQDEEAMLCFMFMIVFNGRGYYAGGAWEIASFLCHRPLTSPLQHHVYHYELVEISYISIEI